LPSRVKMLLPNLDYSIFLPKSRELFPLQRLDATAQQGLFHLSYLNLGSCFPSRDWMLLPNKDCSIFLT
jgi:hypothetical protein